MQIICWPNGSQLWPKPDEMTMAKRMLAPSPPTVGNSFKSQVDNNKTTLPIAGQRNRMWPAYRIRYTPTFEYDTQPDSCYGLVSVSVSRSGSWVWGGCDDDACPLCAFDVCFINQFGLRLERGQGAERRQRGAKEQQATARSAVCAVAIFRK